MICAACGKESADGFRFCPHCGETLNPESSLSGSNSLPPQEAQSATGTTADQPTRAKQEPNGRTMRPGTLVFAAFSAVTCVAAIGKGFPPFYILEAIGWAGAAWYWQRKKVHSELAKVIVIVLAAVVAIGETAHIALQADSKSAAAKNKEGNPFDSVLPATPDTSGASNANDPYAKILGASNGAPPSPVSGCPSSLPAGINVKPLPAKESSDVAGIFGKLISKPAPWPERDDVLLWDADLGFGNKTESCISIVVVELQLDHGEVSTKERHSVVFQPLLGPGQATDAYVGLKIRTTDRGEGVALAGWRTVSVSGFKP